MGDWNDVEAASTADSGADAPLRRVLGPVDATCVVVGAIIGVGIFFTPASVARAAGSADLALLAWAVCGVISLAGALTFAELGGMYTHSGGQYEIIRDAYGPLPAFCYVFCNATAVQAGAIAIIATICTQNLWIAVRGGPPSDAVLPAASTGIIVLLTGANIAGVRLGSRIQNATVFAKVATLLAVTAAALLLGAPRSPVAAASRPRPAAGEVQTLAADASQNDIESADDTATAPAAAPAASSDTAVHAAAPDGATDIGAFPVPPAESTTGMGAVAALFAAMVAAFFSYGGWQHALWIAGEVRRPQRNVPIGIVGGVAVVVAVYLAVNWAYLRLLGHAGVAAGTSPAADAVAAVWSGGGQRAVAAAVGVSAFGVLNAQLLSGPRLVYGMAMDGRFFRIFRYVSPRFQTPAAAILLLSGAALAPLWTVSQDQVDRLLTGVVMVDGVFFVLTGAALFVFRRRLPDRPRPVRAWGYPVVPLLFVLGEIAIVSGAYLNPQTQQAAWIGAAWIVASVVGYLAFFRGDGRADGPPPH